MITLKKTLIAGLAATVIAAGATGAALASSGRNSGNDRGGVHTRTPVLDSHGTGISDDGARIGHENETPEPGDDNGHEVEAGDDNGHEAEQGDDNRGPSENSGPGANDDGNQGHDDGNQGHDDGGNHEGNSGSDG